MSAPEIKKRNNLVVVITGGANGFGRFLAGRFLDKECIVNIIDIVKSERPGNQKFNSYHADISNTEDVKSIFKDIYERYGKIDVLINNAAKRYFSSLQNAHLEDIFETIKINITTNYITSIEALKYMRKNNFGRIINVSSNSSFRGYQEGSIYCATKAALNIFTEAVAKELKNGAGITITAVCPSSMDLKMWSSKNDPEGTCGQIKPERVFKVIYKIINSGLNGEIIPVISLRIYLSHFLYQVMKFLKWGRYFLEGVFRD